MNKRLIEEHAAASAAASEVQLTVDMRVTLHSLVAKPEYNGLSGKVTRVADHTTQGRVGVLVDGKNKAEGFKSANVQLAATELHKTASVNQVKDDKKILVIVQGMGSVIPGVWGRNVLMRQEGGLFRGSMAEYVALACGGATAKLPTSGIQSKDICSAAGLDT